MDSQRRESLELSAGLIEALIQGNDHREEIFACVKDAASTESAVTAIQELLEIAEDGARAILDMQVHRFTDAQRLKLVAQLEVLRGQLNCGQ